MKLHITEPLDIGFPKITDIETAKKSLEKYSIKPIDINGEEYYMMFAHGTSYKMKV